MNQNATVVRVALSPVVEARQVIARCLVDVPARSRGRLAAHIEAELRRAGFFEFGIEQHFSAQQAALLLGRSPDYVASLARRGRLGAVSRDAAGWLIPASGLQAWLDSIRFKSSSQLEKQVAQMGESGGKSVCKRERVLGPERFAELSAALVRSDHEADLLRLERQASADSSDALPAKKAAHSRDFPSGDGVCAGVKAPAGACGAGQEQVGQAGVEAGLDRPAGGS